MHYIQYRYSKIDIDYYIEYADLLHCKQADVFWNSVAGNRQDYLQERQDIIE